MSVLKGPRGGSSGGGQVGGGPLWAGRSQGSHWIAWSLRRSGSSGVRPLVAQGGGMKITLPKNIAKSVAEGGSVGAAEMLAGLRDAAGILATGNQVR